MNKNPRHQSAIRERGGCAECTTMKPGTVDTKCIYWKTLTV